MKRMPQFSKGFLESVARAEADYRAGRVQRVKSLKEIRTGRPKAAAKPSRESVEQILADIRRSQREIEQGKGRVLRSLRDLR